MVDYMFDYVEAVVEENSEELQCDLQQALSVDKVVEVDEYAQRDLARLADDLDHQVSRVKYAAYYAFWFSKLAPLGPVYEVFGGKIGSQIVDINERIAFLMGLTLINDFGFDTSDANEIEGQEKLIPRLWRDCDVCSGECFSIFPLSFMEKRNGQNFHYLVRCLRHRSNSPYLLVMLFESLIYGACVSDDHR